MADGPSEAWYRDLVYNTPRDLWAACFGDDRILNIAGLKKWREYHTPVGRIDLLLASPGRYLVAEFKKGEADEGAVAQALRYTGALEATGLNGEHRTCVVAPEFTFGARMAADAGGVLLVEMMATYRLIPHHKLGVTVFPDDCLELRNVVHSTDPMDRLLIEVRTHQEASL